MIYTHSLNRGARYYPEKIALIYGDRRLTFRELDDRVGRIAASLAQQGFKAGDRLALLLPNSPEYIELVYACAWLGVIAVPLNTRLSPIEIDHVLADVNPRGLIRHSLLPAPVTRVSWQVVIDKDPIDLASGSHPNIVYCPEAILALIYTSGTTGRPKGVQQSHANTLANLDHVNYWMPFQENSVYLHAAPMFHILDFPLIFGLPAFGACQVTIPKFDPQEFCETVQRERVTRTSLVPTMINLLAQFPPILNYDLSSLEELAYGGSPMAPELVRRTREILPQVRLLQGYGLSETGFLTGLKDQEHVDRVLSCGRTCPGIDMRVIDDKGNEAARNHPGELVVRGANITHGYWNNPEDSEALFSGEFIRTGDIGYQDNDGFFYILDRLKDLIVTGGENVYSGEVEAVIYQHPAVHEAAVFGIPDPKWGELVTACVVQKPASLLNADELISFCGRSLANYKVPRRVEFSESELPKNGAGKILKKSLRERFWREQTRGVS